MSGANSSSVHRPAVPTATPVCLIQPPAISSTLGGYHSAPAVLAGFLAADGIRAQQLNLNLQFGQFLLDDKQLEAIAAGNFTPVEPYRQLSCRRSATLLRNHFSAGAPHSGRERLRHAGEWVLAQLESLARDGYSVDLNLDTVLDAPQRYAHLTQIMETFFQVVEPERQIDPGCRLVGISMSMNIQLIPSLLLARWIKARRPDVRVIFGGPTVSFFSQQEMRRLLTERPEVVAAVRYEGEIPLRDLARQVIEDRWAPHGLSGVVCLDDKGRLVDPAPAPGPDLESLPYPLYDTAILAQCPKPGLAIIQARGCYWGKCAYCDYTELYSGSRPYRTRKVEGFVAEIEAQIEATGVRGFLINTDSIPPAFARKLSQTLIARGIDMRWGSFAMVDPKFDRELLALMKQAGCTALTLGMESMTSRVLALVQKRANREANLRFMEDARVVGMRLHVNMIPDLPTTTFEEAMEGLDLLRGFTDVIHMLRIFQFEMTYTSRIGQNPTAFGIEARPAVEGSRQNHMECVDPAMTPVQRQAVIAAYQGLSREIAHRHHPSMLGTLAAAKPRQARA